MHPHTHTHIHPHTQNLPTHITSLRVHLSQYQAVNDVLNRRSKTAEDVESDPTLKKEVAAAVAGAGETVLNFITVEANDFTSPINWGDSSKNEVRRNDCAESTPPRERDRA